MTWNSTRTTSLEVCDYDANSGNGIPVDVHKVSLSIFDRHRLHYLY